MEISPRLQNNISQVGLITGAICLIGGTIVSGIHKSYFPILFTLLLLLSAYPWYRSLKNGNIVLLEPINVRSVFFFMIVIALFERVYIADPHYTRDIISRSFEEGFLLLCSLFALLFASILVGYYAIGPRIPSPLLYGSKLRSLLSDADRTPGWGYRAVGGTYMLLGLACIGAIVIYVFPTNDPFYIYRTSRPRSETFAGNNVFVIFARSLYIGYLLWLGGALADRRTPSIFEFSLVFPIVGLFLLLGGRSRSLIILIMVAILFYFIVIENWAQVHRGHFIRLAGQFPPAVVFVVFPVTSVGIAIFVVSMRAVRLGGSVIEGISEIDPFSIATAGVQNGQLDNFLALTEIVPERTDFFYGSFYLRVPLNLIPRSIWPDKPVLYTGAWLRRIIFPNQSGGRPPGVLGDYYINFGYPGIPLLGAVYGIFLHLLYRLIERDNVRPLPLVIFAVFLPIIGQTGLTNGTLSLLQFHLILFTPAIIALIIISTITD